MNTRVVVPVLEADQSAEFGGGHPELGRRYVVPRAVIEDFLRTEDPQAIPQRSYSDLNGVLLPEAKLAEFSHAVRRLWLEEDSILRAEIELRENAPGRVLKAVLENERERLKFVLNGSGEVASGTHRLTKFVVHSLDVKLGDVEVPSELWRRV